MFKEEYLKALIDERPAEKSIELTLPFLDHHRDNLCFYLYKEGTTVVITDGGYWVQELGCYGIPEDQIKLFLDIWKNCYGVQEESGELLVRVPFSDLSEGVNNSIALVYLLIGAFI
jgi:hypothetical protein